MHELLGANLNVVASRGGQVANLAYPSRRQMTVSCICILAGRREAEVYEVQLVPALTER